MRAVVGRTIQGRSYSWRVLEFENRRLRDQLTDAPTPQLTNSLGSRCQVLEPRELPDEREPDDTGGPVALFGDEQFGDPLRVGSRLALVLVHVFAIDED